MSDPSVLNTLLAVIADRKANADAGTSYVASLLRGGTAKIGGKILEEAGEVVEAADEPGPEGRAHFVHEVADLLFHTLVMLSAKDVPWQDVEAELARRFGTSGHAEKAARRETSGPGA